uniref:SCO-spondin n=1 Tax=Astatotilapia calliptera TaxID=8154 RepID=A0A3P8NP04_ASTCA
IFLIHWCEHRTQERVEQVLSPRLQLEVRCSEVYQYNTQGWRLDVDRMRVKHGGDDGIALYYKQQGSEASCFMYKPPEIQSQMLNKTARACCEGWAGPRCSEAVGVRGQCYSTWNCVEFPGVHNSSLMPMEQCCSTLWGLSWRNKPCTYVASVPQSSATCMSWGGVHYRTFDRKHFHFQGSCTYLLASSTDGTWAVYISTALRMMLGLDLVAVHRRNLTLNNLHIPNGQPLFQNGVSVHWLGDFVFVESGLGVRVKFDLVNTVYLTVTAEHMAATRGLCGIYNNNADDDFTTTGGSVSQYAASFGNSWKVPDQHSEGCSDAAELGHSCDVTGDTALRQEAESVCRRLLENPFTHCHPQLDPAAYIDTCLYLFCSLPAKEREGAVCDTLASYARECAQQHIILMWRTPTLCDRVCPRGQVFSDCISSCPPSCTSPQPPAAMGQCRDECVGGCECPPGLYFHQGRCLKRDDCPCFHRRRTYQSGDKIQQRCNTCVCSSGQWQCTGEKCAAECALMGGLQVTTFDKKRYSLQGSDFVSVRCGECTAGGGEGGGGCLKEMSVTALRTTKEAVPLVTGDLAVLKASSSFLLIQMFGAQILWYLDGPLAFITLQPGFGNKVRGLCGTLTWNQRDDFTTPEGDVENSVTSFVAKFTTALCTLPGGAAPEACSTYTQRRQYAETVCAVLHSPIFQLCHDVVEREPYFRLCLSEVCSCVPQGSCHCTVLTAYARHCAQEGVVVQWRNRTFCTMQCSGGQVYQECGRTCGNSCSDLRHSWSCDDSRSQSLCVPGCQCPPGLVQDQQGQCVPISLCPCMQGAVMYSPGAMVQNNCNTCVCEQGLFNCTQELCEEVNQCPGTLVYSPRSCLLTCSSLDPPGQQQGSSVMQSSCREPLSGCVCPQGTVLLGDRCVLPDECPCHHNGRLYYSNDTITKDCNTCVCNERRWHCGRSACAGVCVATGDPHYVTFDGRCYSFLGDCQYVLARETSGLFSVTAENVPCGSTGVTCTKSVTLSLGNTVIHLLRGNAVTVNGMPVSLPKSYSGSGLTLEKVGLFVSLSSRLGVTLLWDGGMRVYVRLAAHLRGRVGGLCGNFDGDTENDFTTRQGIVESTAELFGNSWKVSPSCPDVADQDLRDPCALNSHRVTWARKKCAVLTQGLFSRCHPEVPFQQYYDWCVFDACGCDSGGDCECLCTAIATYAEECNRRGVYIHWRSQELCPLQCDNGLVYDPCGPACSRSCPTIQQGPHSSCDAVSCVEGCFCPAGTVRHGDSCVAPSQCPCEWDGSLFPAGAAVTQHCQNCSCEEGVWKCDGVACPPPSPPCLESEFTCAGGRCIPTQWVCDNEDDCGDGSDEILNEPQPCSGPCLNLALRCDGHPDCADQSDEDFCGPATPVPLCPPGEFQCANGKCLPASRVCDGWLDCGFADGSDEQDCGVVCDEGEFLCAGGRCILYLHRCDGHNDCGDLSDERGCVCAPGEFQCRGDQCVPADRVCDGTKDCPSGSDEAVCPSKVTCAPDQFACGDGTCVAITKLCDGATDCSGREDENRTNCFTSTTTPSLLPVTPTSACRSYEFSCATVGQCVPQAWRCDGETDCMDGSDEQQCGAPCGSGQVPCVSGDQCVEYQQLCDGTPHCRDTSDESIDNCGSTRIPPCLGSFPCDNRTCVNMSQVCNGVPDCPRGEDELVCALPGSNTTVTCSEFTCMDGTCVPFNVVCNGVPDCPDSSLGSLGDPTDEQGCKTWSSWGPWSPCSTTCGTGFMSRERSCPPGDLLHHCRGQDIQRQECFNTTCPVDGRWLPWGSWSNCSSGCGGVQVRNRACTPPLYGGQDCSQLPGPSNLSMETKPCLNDGCDNTSCPTGLVRHSCAPCPLSCAHISSESTCDPRCWCPEGQVMSHTQQCVSPEECVCEVAGVRYWPGQQIKVDCEVCVCETGRPQRCQPNPDCSIHCGWSSWSEWGECLGPCGVQSVQWSFRSPNNPPKHGDGRTCRGIYRKARRCQTAPCEECEYHGQSHTVGDRWRSDQCQLCRCLPNLTVQCSPYCPYAATGCPQVRGCVWLLFIFVGKSASVLNHANFVYPCSCLEECWSPLGVQSLPASSFSASSQQAGHPPDAARLHAWDPHSDLQRRPDSYTGNTQSPYIQIDLLKPYNITGVLTQGGGVFGTFVSSFFLQFSRDGNQWYTHKELVTDAPPRAKVQQLDRIVSAQFVRLLPHDFQNGIYLRLEIMGCGTQPSTTATSPRSCPAGQFSCPPPGGCIEAWKRCDGNPHCPRGEDESGCHPHDNITAHPRDTGSPRVICVQGQFACGSFGCVDSAQVCDGIRHCLDGSDEQHCGAPAVTPQRPTVPSPCSPKQFSCDSGECVHLDRRCDLQKDCVDGSDEKDCVDCVMSPWTAWSACSVSCGLGSLFRQRDMLREALPGGACSGDPFDSRACFPQACPVNGHWSEWTEWSECDARCGGGVSQRNRSCSAPPPKNGGRDCEGMTRQSQSCNSQPCTKDTDTQTGCVRGMVVVTEEDCQAGRVDPCPPTCSHLSLDRNCTAECISGCRCPYGLYLQQGRCVNSSQCVCHWDGQTLHPGQVVPRDQCTTCKCRDGQVTCDRSSCVATCHWSAWSSWSPCDVTCGLGLQQRYRSLPAGAVRGQPCPGDSSEAQSCSSTCFPALPGGTWSKWTGWSECSKTCFNHVDDVGVRRRFRSCTPFNHTQPACDGDSEEQEPCNTEHCPVPGGWSAWSAWSQCSSRCDSGVQTRERLCNSPTPQHGGKSCSGPHIQTRDCNSQPCSGVCPEGMTYMTVRECEAQGGACPRVCLDMTSTEVQCATTCYDGCYCAPGFYLLNSSCVPLAQCPCYHQGEMYPAGATLPVDACNNCTCTDGEMQCGTAPCPVDCGWSSWTQWSACSRTCDVGVRRRYRSGTDPPPAFGGRPCKGDRVGIDTCSIEPCLKEPWSPWSECSVTCGGGYRTRTRGPIRIHGTTQQFSTCNLQPCGNTGTCPPGQEWMQCMMGAVSCMDLTLDLSRNCTPGCRCPRGTVQQDGVCVSESDCRCDVGGEQYNPGDTVPLDCSNCTCEGGRLVTCSRFSCNVDGQWSAWTPWGHCSVSCGAGLQSRYRFCSSPRPSGSGLPCTGPHHEDQVCIIAPCDLAPCSQVPGTVFSSCGPSCPRSCDDLTHCEWHCEPGCYCTEGKVMSANGTVCLEKEDCPCLDLNTGRRLEPGDTIEAIDGCNNCTCEGGKFNCTRNPCPVSGGWCEWSEWTPCSRTCGAESVTRYRSCSCPEPEAGGEPCSGEQELHSGVGVQIHRQPCPSVPGCHVDGGWSRWSPWSRCDKRCGGGRSIRTRSCSSPPPKNGGKKCAGEKNQVKPCNTKPGCPPGQEFVMCASQCPQRCSDLQQGIECQTNSECQPGCRCPQGQLQQDGVCVQLWQCDCVDSLGQIWVAGSTHQVDCNNCTCSDGQLLCSNDSCQATLDGAWTPWSVWSDCSATCGRGTHVRTRACINPPPRNNGSHCSGPEKETQDCQTPPCLEWTEWSECDARCGGGVRQRNRSCSAPPPKNGGRDCEGMTRQSQSCNSQPCVCPVGMTYMTVRECEAQGGACPRVCLDMTSTEVQCATTCYDGCYCAPGFYLLNSSCLAPPCLLINVLLLSPSVSVFSCLMVCCVHGRWNCSLEHCPVHGALSSWGPWSPCSLSCGGLGLKTRSRGCTQPAPARGGRDCQGPRRETTYCQAPDCPATVVPTEEPATPEEDSGFSPWSPWSPCTKTCTDALSPALKSRHRQCVTPACSGSSHQEKACNLPQCPGTPQAECARRNCSWTKWAEWSACSRSCGVGQQQRIRTFLSPGTNGSWCEDILGGNVEHRFCNIKPCRVDGGWSRWSPWSRCDKRCGGGRSIRTRSCSSPPPKNGGKKCAGEKNQVKPCNTKPCDDRGCPPGQEFVMCASQCPQRCSDLQQGIECQTNSECQPGCRCPQGTQLQQDGVCVQLWQCDCVDSLGQIWVAGSTHQVDCNNCTCSDGQLLCSNDSCQATCVWSSWSSWAPCSVSCGQGQRTRYRSLTPDTEGTRCHFEEVQHRPCSPGTCPPLCLLDNQTLSVGDTWLQGECKQCTCTPEGVFCQDIDCRGASPYDLCPWSPWSPCSQTCGAGSVSRHRACVCEQGGDAACPPEIEAERNRVETQLCYKQPCPGCPMSAWSVWSQCSCASQRQQRYRVALSSPTRGQQFCEAPFVYSSCGAPCEKQCELRGREDLCLGVSECTPGCYCPQGLLQYNGSCVPPEECGCIHLQHQAPGDPPTPVTVPQGATVTIGCSTCLCHDGSLQCDMRECEVVLSEWSGWTRCSPCVLQHNSSQMVSIQRRFRACLDLDSGLPVSKEEESQCPGLLVEERPCPDANICRDVCQWSGWSAWTACAEPCSGGVRQRYRQPLASPAGPQCRSQETQTQGCNTALCPGERCEDRDRASQDSCANKCPRSCTDLWEHVQCLQGACHPGCRCPEGQLLQDGRCVPVTECRCGIPSGNGTLEFLPEEEFTVDCNTCVCEHGTVVCSKLPCPVYEPWSPWSACSASCERGRRTRTRRCQDTEGGPPCAEVMQTEICDLPSCPAGCLLSEWSAWSECSASCDGGLSLRNKTVLREPEPGGTACVGPLEQHVVCNTNSCLPECPGTQVSSDCSASCPYTCQDLWPHTQCLPGPCTPGCTCPPGQVLHRGSCVAHADCPCSPLSLPADFQSWNVSSEYFTEALLPPGAAIQHLYKCTLKPVLRLNVPPSYVLLVDCQWSTWSQWSPCSASCGAGQQSSIRLVLEPNQYGGAPCEGPNLRTTTCIAPDCACPDGEQWRRTTSEGILLCERSCQDIYSSSPVNCSHSAESCVCQEGLYRNPEGACVIPALCPCHDRGVLQAGSEWEEDCLSCSCVNGRKLCRLRCPPLSASGLLYSPLLCSVLSVSLFLSAFAQGEPVQECHRYVQVRNITKGDCRLDNVEVSFCRGRCLSRTDVILEEPYLQSVCECCSYRLDPNTPVRFLSLQCESGESEPVVLPVIHSCECTSCQGEA